MAQLRCPATSVSGRARNTDANSHHGECVSALLLFSAGGGSCGPVRVAPLALREGESWRTWGVAVAQDIAEARVNGGPQVRQTLLAHLDLAYLPTTKPPTPNSQRTIRSKAPPRAWCACIL